MRKNLHTRQNCPVKILIKDIYLSVDHSIITETFQDQGCTLIDPSSREKLRIGGKLTHCETNDRIIFVKPLKNPLPKIMKVGMFRATVIHAGQSIKTQTCGKCLQGGHRFSECENDPVCKSCKESGHKQSDCPYAEASEDLVSNTDPAPMGESSDPIPGSSGSAENAGAQDSAPESTEDKQVTKKG